MVAPSAFILLAFVGAFFIGGQLNSTATTVEVYPPHVRGTGIGWTFGVGRLGSIVGPLVGGALLSAQLGWDKLFLIAAIPAVVAAVCILLVQWLKPKSSETV